jgi:hypothetical protein
MDAAAFIARKLGATFASIDCPLGRSMLAECLSKLTEEYESTAMRLREKRLLEEALGETLAASFRLWEESDPGSELLLQFAVPLVMMEAVTPEATPSTLTADPKQLREATAQREWGMRRNIIDLCSGKLTGKPHKRVLAIVGREHVAPLIALLKAA